MIIIPVLLYYVFGFPLPLTMELMVTVTSKYSHPFLNSKGRPQKGKDSWEQFCQTCTLVTKSLLSARHQGYKHHKMQSLLSRISKLMMDKETNFTYKVIRSTPYNDRLVIRLLELHAPMHWTFISLTVYPVFPGCSDSPLRTLEIPPGKRKSSTEGLLPQQVCWIPF